MIIWFNLSTWKCIAEFQIIASKNLEKDDTYRFLADLLGDGLITCNRKYLGITEASADFEFIISHEDTVNQFYRKEMETSATHCWSRLQYVHVNRELPPHFQRSGAKFSQGFRDESERRRVLRYLDICHCEGILHCFW